MSPRRAGWQGSGVSMVASAAGVWGLQLLLEEGWGAVDGGQLRGVSLPRCVGASLGRLLQVGSLGTGGARTPISAL